MDEGLPGDHVSSANAFQKYLSALRGRVGDAKYKSWFVDLDLAEMKGDCVTLTTGSEAKRDMIDNRFMPILTDTWRKEVGPVRKVMLTVQKNLRAHAAKVDAEEERRTYRTEAPSTSLGRSINGDLFVADADKSKASRQQADFSEIATPIDPRRTFGAFAVGDTNRMGWAAAQQTLSDSQSKELIYIYGQSGVGKTHLLHAIAHEWQNDPSRGTAAYITYNNLSSACVNAVWSNSVQALHKELLDNSLLSFDDIHFLEGKSRTQEELLNLIDAALDGGKQIVIAGELPPSKLAEAGINKRLADRLAGGICAPVHQGNEGLRIEVLKKRVDASAAKCQIADDVLEFIARVFTKSMRETIGALNQLLLMYGAEDRVVDLDQAKAILKSLMDDRRRAATLDDAIAAGAEAFDLKVEDITGRAQPQRIARARHAIVWCAREVLKDSFPRIGKALKRDHTTVMSSYRRAQALLERDKAFQDAVRRIREALEG